MRRISGTTWVSIGINAVKVVEATVAAMSRAIWILPKAASRSRFLRSGIQRSPTGAAFTILLRGDSGMVQRLATEMYARGLSTRDIEDAFTDEQGRCLLSRSKVSEVTEVLWEQYQAFQERDLSDFPLLCLFLDGLYEPLRTHGITREAVLCAWGITLDGRKVLVSLGLGSKESGEAWLEFVRDLDRRGLPAPLFVTTDGADGLIQTIDQMWPKSLRRRKLKLKLVREKMLDDPWKDFPLPTFDLKALKELPALDNILKELPESPPIRVAVALHCCNSTVPLHCPPHGRFSEGSALLPGFLNKVTHGENPMPCGRLLYPLCADQCRFAGWEVSEAPGNLRNVFLPSVWRP